jgi:cytochrome c-type biogenesis protein CcmE
MAAVAAGSARHNSRRMDRSRKRRVRFVVALSAAVLLAGALVYTSFSASSEASTPSQLVAAAEPGKTYQLTGKVVAGYSREGTITNFRVRDRAGHVSVPVRYEGSLPDPFRAEREVIVDVRKRGDLFVAEPGSLVTKCPSKFTAEKT